MSEARCEIVVARSPSLRTRNPEGDPFVSPGVMGVRVGVGACYSNSDADAPRLVAFSETIR